MTYRMAGRTVVGRLGLGGMVLALVAMHPLRANAQRREAPWLDGPGAERLALERSSGVAGAGLPPAPDTLPARRRPVAIEYSDWYARRLKIHQVASWTMLPLFAVQYAAGQQLLDKGKYGAPQWARDWHGPLAGATGILFGVNTLTGAWNLWDSRQDPKARKWRTAHAVLMLVADAGFALTPAFADNEGGSSESRLQTHKNVAVTSMGIAVASWLMMLPPFRRE